jgi:hypothetical protein
MRQIRVADLRMKNSATFNARMITNTALCTTSHPPTYHGPESPKLKNGNSDMRRLERQHRHRAQNESAAVPHMVTCGKKCSTSIDRWCSQAKMLLWRLIEFLDRHKLLPSVTPEEMLRRERRQCKKKTCQPPESGMAPCSNTSSMAQEVYTGNNLCYLLTLHHLLLNTRSC